MTSTSTDSASTERVSFWDTFNSMTGYEEMAVEKAFGATPGELTKKSFSGNWSLDGMRAMVFVIASRAGDPDPYATAMSLTRTQLADRFLSDEEDADDAIPDEPDTELGKDDSPDA
ncbi:hypothetical protein RB608_11985 [Nocardioides sp. LHD-245]|uniref:hypothetical protein n=1 Tax=Nocardioides sp. LHD-245 TaxID=3051387 RepID=UPI0027DF9083|nr:hypothetical protein [Nocardioides sp. LHD-245]